MRIELFRGMAYEMINKGSKDRKAMEWTEFKYVKIRYRSRLAEAKVFIENFVYEKMKEKKRLRDYEDAKFFAAHPQAKPDLSANTSIMTIEPDR